MDREFAGGPPLTLHLPVPALFAAVWAATRESLLAGPTDRILREVSSTTLQSSAGCGTLLQIGQQRGGAIDADERHDIQSGGSISGRMWSWPTRPGRSPSHNRRQMFSCLTSFLAAEWHRSRPEPCVAR